MKCERKRQAKLERNKRRRKQRRKSYHFESYIQRRIRLFKFFVKGCRHNNKNRGDNIERIEKYINKFKKVKKSKASMFDIMNLAKENML